MLIGLFKVHSILEQDSNGGYHELLILENQSGRIVAIDRENDKVIAKVRRVLCGLTRHSTLKIKRKCDNKNVVFQLKERVINYTMSMKSMSLRSRHFAQIIFLRTKRECTDVGSLSRK